VLCLVTSLTRLAGQTTTGSIVGTVSDPSGAVIAGANITVTNINTGIAVKTTSDSAGDYVVTPLSVGRYSVTVEAAGFKKTLRTHNKGNGEDRVGVDAPLEGGGVPRTLGVRGGAPAFQTRPP